MIPPALAVVHQPTPGGPSPSLHPHYHASSLLRDSPPLLPALVLCPSRIQPFGVLPLHRDCRFSRSMQEPKPGSRHLYAGYRLVSKQVSSRLVPRHPCSLGFDIVIRGFDASSNG